MNYSITESFKNEILQGQVSKEQMDYWRTQLINVSGGHNLPLDHVRQAVQTFTSGIHRSRLTEETCEHLNDLCQEENTNIFTGLQVVFAVLLARYSNEIDIVMGSPAVMAKQDKQAELDSLQANTLLTDTMALRNNLTGNPSFSELLSQSKEMLLAAHAIGQLSVGNDVDKLEMGSGLNPSSLFQVMIVIEEPEQQEDFGNYDLCLKISENEAGLHLDWLYNAELFESATITRLANHFELLLVGLSRSPDKHVFSVDMLSKEEIHQQLVEWNDTAADYPTDKCIHELFETQVVNNPDAIAVVFEDSQLTYAELNSKANQLAHYLVEEKHVTPDTLVGLCVDRSLEMIIGMLAILKAGGAYVPLDPDYPEARLVLMIEDAQLDTVLTQRQLADKIPVTTEQAVYLNDELILDKLAQYSTRNLSPNKSGLTAHHLAYVIYRSGSTGHPKGVLIAHQSVTSLVINNNFVELNDKTVILVNAPIAFDAATFEIWGGLLNGGKLVVQGERGVDLIRLGDLINKNEITVAWMTSGLFDVFSSLYKRKLPSLINLLVGGDVIKKQAVSNVRELNPDLNITNGYGPTENTVFSCCYPIPENVERLCSIPVGKSLSNRGTFILNEMLHVQPLGVAGELHVSGAGLARGYLNQPALTEEKFIANPFSDEPDAKLYKTGDLCRYLPDGNVEFIGRIDNQVKIRGFRIEFGEIESSLSAFDEVNDVVVVARENPSGDKSLVAYVVTDEAGDFTGEDESSTYFPHEFIEGLRQGLHQSLPDYMVPSAFVVLDKLPLTSNGKIDRKALAEPDIQSQIQDQYVAPRTVLETQLCKVWEKVLGISRIGIDDNFFRLGGNSIAAVKLTAISRREMGLDIPLPVLLTHKTIAAIAPLLSQEDNLVIPKVATEHYALSFAQ